MNNSKPAFIFFFGAGKADGNGSMKHILGGKGAGLAEMTSAGLNVPPGFTISAECCAHYYENGKQWPDGLEEAVRYNLERLEQMVQRPFGRGDNPLLVAVRSGAAHSMPGMMDTVLNVGLNPECVRHMAERTEQHRAAWEAYRHFLVMYGQTVAGIDGNVFTDALNTLLREAGKTTEEDLTGPEMESLCVRFLDLFPTQTGHAMPTEPWQMLCRAIDAVFESWNNERAITYRKHHKIDGLLGTAVNVQMMCPSEVSGVMFTANPVNPALGQMIVESSFGLGEAVVLGKVTPDRFIVNKQTFQISERAIADKKTIITTLTAQNTLEGIGRKASRHEASLTDDQVAHLARLGLRVENYFKFPCDVEWGLSQGEFYLLQARQIRGLDRAGSPNAVDPQRREEVRRSEIEQARGKAIPSGTVWSRFNLSEILPDPTPMTWAIVKRFMSGRGGFGLMYRDMGFDPDPALDEAGIFDLICGRPYCNLNREPRMQYHKLPLEHSFAALKAAPNKALYPQARMNPFNAGWKFWLFLPFVLPITTWKMSRAQTRRARLMETFPDQLRKEIIPAFSAAVDREADLDLSVLPNDGLLNRLESWIQRTLFDFARESLKPTALAAFAMGSVERVFTPRLGHDRTQAALRELVMGVHPDPEADLPAAIRDLSTGKMTRADFLRKFGHRGSHEMELSHPRWSEAHENLDKMSRGHQETPKVDRAAAAWQRIAFEARLTLLEQKEVMEDLKSLHTYLGLRETGKHYLMKGYAQIRRILVELDRRFNLDGGIFYLTPDDLPRLLAGEDLSAKIREAREYRAVALSLEAPQVLFSDDLEAIGRPIVAAGTDSMQGVALSAGTTEGIALVLEEPTMEGLPTEPFILVCPSTDPAWVPLFVEAKGLVMETGGVLSHGAIVARDFGLPAVAGLPDIHKRIRTGQKLRIDGTSGTVTVLG